LSLPRHLDPAFASTDDLMAAASITRSTVKTWQDLGFLPPPLKISLGMAGGVFNRYPAWAVDRARFVAEKRAAGFTYDEVLAMLPKQEAHEARMARAQAPAATKSAKAAAKPTKPATKPAAAEAKPAKAAAKSAKPAKAEAKPAKAAAKTTGRSGRR
jgi:DNA-binding transcriptional MerR regulator